MAQQQAAVAPKPSEPAIAVATLAVAVSFEGGLERRYPASKFTITRDERGDVRITAKNGRSLLVPKQLAILEFSPGG